VCESPFWPFAIPGNKAVTVSLQSGMSTLATTSRSALFYLAGTFASSLCNRNVRVTIRAIPSGHDIC
jgi:hypothetical protein